MVSALGFEVEDFNKEVIGDSYNLPVLVDYWADWCGPCKFLGPIIEKLASKAKGKWKLVKVDTEANPDIAADWGIKGIPNLKLFYKGEVIDQVAGAMSEVDMQSWLREKLPSKAKTLTMEAINYLNAGDTAAGINKLEEALIEDNSLSDTRLLLAGQKIWTSPNDVKTLLDGINYLDHANEILLMAEVQIMDLDIIEGSAAGNDLLKAIAALKIKEFASSIECLIHSIIKDKSYHNELARKLAIAVFHHLGEGHKVTRQFRRNFDMALY